jgi:preprotein translocase subunit SecA
MKMQHGDTVAAANAARPADVPKLGRNDPCYCGSGLKFKKCHGR